MHATGLPQTHAGDLSLSIYHTVYTLGAHIFLQTQNVTWTYLTVWQQASFH